MKQLIFIGGTGGSGTRALAQMFNDVGFYSGSHLNSERDSMYIEQSFLDKWVRPNIGGETCPINEVKDSFANALNLQLPNAENKDCVIKAVRSAFILPLIWEASPNFKYVHMVRDGRDMAFSSNYKYVEYYAHFFFDDEPEWIKGKNVKGELRNIRRTIKMWNRQNVETYKQGQTMGDKYMFIKYEDLCNNNRKAYDQLADFIGVDRNKLWAQRKNAKLSSRSGKWKKKPGNIINDLEVLASEGLSIFGYK